MPALEVHGAPFLTQHQSGSGSVAGGREIENLPSPGPNLPIEGSSSADMYRPVSPIYNPSSPLVPPNLSEASRDSVAMSSIHSPGPGEIFQGRDSRMTWAEGSEMDLTGSLANSPWHKEGEYRDSRLGSTAVLYQGDDEQGHTYPTSAIGEKGAPQSARNLGQRRRRKRFIVVGFLSLLAAIAIGVGVGVSLSDKHASGGNGGEGTNGTTGVGGGKTTQLWGVGGDNITTEDGTTFLYNNTLGGTWVAVPFNNTAKPQGDQPALNEDWDYSYNRMMGVNIGGWLVIEPFIVPSLFEPYENASSPAVDEWTLCEILGSSMATTIENHYKTFITEEDFAAIAAAGLNWVRLPVGWWMIEVWEGEPFLEGVSFKYFLKAIEWARKYGLRINLDLHAVPGSQNGFNHSGKLGSINFLMGLMGIANAQRSLNYMRVLTEFISQPQYQPVVPMFSVLNEALMQQIGSMQLREYYYQVYEMIRGISGIGTNKGPFMVIHDGFGGTGGGHLSWGGYLAGADRLGLDTHPYLCFSTQNNDSIGYNSFKPCSFWATSYNQTMTDFGFNFAGEFSVAINDCGQYLNNVGFGSRYEGTYPNASAPDTTNYPRMGSCDPWNDYPTWSDDLKSGFADLAWASQDAMRNSFFWTWKIGNSTKSDLIPNPMWSYQLGLAQGWMRPDARRSNGGCAVVASKRGTTAPTQTWASTLSAWQTGGTSAGTIEAAQVSNYSTWPPASITVTSGQSSVYSYSNLPQYTPTGTIVTLTPTAPASSLFPSGDKSTAQGAGWANSADTTGWWVSASGCSYANPWSGQGLPYPASSCPTAGQGTRRERERREAVAAVITPAPRQ